MLYILCIWERAYIMKYLKQIFIILAVSFAGELLKYFIPLPISASVYGIILMFLLLLTKVIKVEDVKEVSTFLIDIMPVLFLPAAVGIMDSWGVLKSNWVAYLVITVVSTLLVMFVSGRSTQFVLKKKQAKEEKKAEIPSSLSGREAGLE